MFVHVIADLESKFDSLKDALETVDSLNHGTPLRPYVPNKLRAGENGMIKRVPLCANLADALFSIGLAHTFHRCLDSGNNTKSYTTIGKETYPIIVCYVPVSTDIAFPSKAIAPYQDTIPEYWARNPVYPQTTELVWLNSWSIQSKNLERPKTVRVYSTQDVTKRRLNHPWLNGRGHNLTSEKMERYRYAHK